MLIKFDSSVCRICLKSKGAYSLFESAPIAKNFNFVTLLEVSRSDNLPPGLCQQCYLSLRVAAHIKRQAISANRELKSYLRRINETFLTLPSRTKIANDDSISDININELAELCPEENDQKDIFIQENNENSSDPMKSEGQIMNVNEIKVNFIELNNDDEEYDIEELMEETNAIECDELPTDINKLIRFKKTPAANEENSNVTKVYENKTKKFFNLKDDPDIDNELERNSASSLDLNFDNSNALLNKNKDTIDFKYNKKYKKRRYVPDIIKASSVLNNESDSLQKINSKRRIPGVINDIFRCGECDNTFTTKLNLDRHMEIHLNRRKAFSCETCGKLFTQLNSVREHMLTHTGEKPYKCNICEKAFSRRQIYRRHLLTHTKIKKYECKQCDQKFTVKRTLFLHKTRIHGDGEAIEHKCEICSKIYRSKYTLSDHLQNVHDISL